MGEAPVPTTPGAFPHSSPMPARAGAERAPDEGYATRLTLERSAHGKVRARASPQGISITSGGTTDVGSPWGAGGGGGGFGGLGGGGFGGLIEDMRLILF
jgi:hypothetical protein